MLALVYDVHGNLPALEAVLEDAEGAGADRYLLGGDYGVFGAWPAETVERLRKLDATWIRGNVDRWCADPADAPEPARPAIERCRELLGDETVAELAALPEQVVLDGTRYCHASPKSDMDAVPTEPSPQDEQLLAGATEQRIVFGHTHLQFSRTGPGGVELVNPGSVGMPFGEDRRAAYALVGTTGEVEPRRVAYDWKASVAAIRERLGEAGELGARRTELGRLDV